MNGSVEQEREVSRRALQRIEFGRTALEKIGLSYQDIREIADEQVDGVLHVLLTSSIVQGLATPTSDYDLICVVEGVESSDRTAAQLFRDNRRIELMIYPNEEVGRALNRLNAVSELSPVGLMRSLHTWDQNCPIKLKFLERLINGVSDVETTPYSQYVPQLAKVWRIKSFDKAQQYGVLAAIAQQAGEHRSVAAYGIQCVLYLMDSLMSASLDVYSNAKWFLLRWEIFLADATNHSLSRQMISLIASVWEDAENCLKHEGSIFESKRLMGLVLEVATFVGVDVTSLKKNLDLSLRSNSEVEPFGGGGQVTFSEKGLAVIGHVVDQTEWSVNSYDELLHLDQISAGGILRASRSNQLNLSMSGWKE